MVDVRAQPAESRADVLALGVGFGGVLLDGIPDAALPGSARAAAEAYHAEGRASAEPGEVRELALVGTAPATLLLAGIGAAGERELRTAGAALVRVVRGESVDVAMPGLTGDRLAALVEGLALGAHRFKPGPLRTVSLVADADAHALERGRAYAAGAAWARDLTNTPALVKTPAWLGAQAAAVLRPLGVRVEVRDEQWLTAHRFGGVLGVGGGSSSPPRLIEASWRPRGAGAGPHPVIVGKGITFDSGGLNLKPGEGMRMMHTDMGGGAAALAALRVIATLRARVRVSVLVPTAENAVSGSAMRPGDVLRHYGGRTTEVRNTDAEGRLVLADALAYAAARLRPSALVDVATLTGAVKVALGLRVAGLFATSEPLADALIRAGADADEPLWRMPLVDDYAPQLDSEVADSQNMPGNPGAITAALFLRPFAAGLPWAHLDIAGAARATADAGVLTSGATGFGARLLARWVESLA